MGRQLIILCVLFASLATSSCSILTLHRMPRADRGARTPSVSDSATFMLATGTSPRSLELAQAAGEQSLQRHVADTLARGFGLTRFRLRSGEEVGIDSLARTEATAALMLRWPDLRGGLATLHVDPAPESSDGLWSCRLRLRYRVADHRAMLGELKLRMESRLGQLSDAADSTEVLATTAPFKSAVHRLSMLYARGVSEWLVPPEDMSAIVARRIDRLLRRIRIRFSSVRPEDCLYFVSVRAVDAAGRRLPAVPLAAKLPPGTGQVTPPSLPSNDFGEAVFLVRPSVTDSLPITVEVPRQGLADLISTSPAASSALLSALGRHAARVQMKTVLDLHEQGKVTWHVGLVTRWSKRRSLFGSSADLVMIVGDVVIESASPFSRRVALSCTRVVMGKEEWVPEGKGLLLASFRVSEAGRQIRRLSTTQLLERVNDLVRRSKGGTPPPIRMCFALDLDAACSWTATRMEQWQVLPYSLP